MIQQFYTNICIPKTMYKNIYRSTVLMSPKFELTQNPLVEWINMEYYTIMTTKKPQVHNNMNNMR